MRSDFTNRDHPVVKLTFHTPGTENMTLWQGQSNAIHGPEGASFRFAWKLRDELITADELDAFGTEGVYGTDYTFGDLPGKVP